MHYLVRISFRDEFRLNGLLHAETWGLAMVGLVFANTEDDIYIMLMVERKYEVYIALDFQFCFSSALSFNLRRQPSASSEHPKISLTATRIATMSSFPTNPDTFEKDRDALAITF